MDINRTRSSASADAGQAGSAERAEGARTQPAALQFASAAPQRDLVTSLANLRTHVAARAAADAQSGAGASGSASGNAATRRARLADIHQAVATMRMFAQQVATGMIDTQTRWQASRILAHDAFTQGREALVALNGLDKKQRTQFERTGEAALLASQTMSAGRLALATYQTELDALRQNARRSLRAARAALDATAGQGAAAARAGEALVVATERAYSANAPRLDQMMDELQPYREGLHEFLAPYFGPNVPGNAEKMQLVLETAAVGIAGGHDLANKINRERVSSHAMRVGRFVSDIDVLSRTNHLVNSFSPQAAAALDRITDRHQDPRAAVSADENEWLQAYIENLDGHADYFCLRASEQAQNPHPERDALLLGLADALGSMLRTLDGIRSQPKLPAEIVDRSTGRTLGGQTLRRPEDKEVSAAPSAAQVSSGHDDWAVTLPAPRAEPQRARRAGKSRSRPGSSARGPQAGAQASGPSRTPSATVSEATLAAQKRLRAFPEPAALPETSARAFLALGRALNKDTAALELMAAPESNPLTFAHMMRDSVSRWFGNRAQWQRAKDALGAAPASGDDAQAQLHRALDARLAGIDAILAQIDTVELDATKRYLFPKAVHVEKLLGADAVASVSSLRVLPPFDAADPNKGTTFEAEIRLRPTSDGNATPSLYLHLHTRTSVDAQTCRTLGFDDLEAKHVKTADQSRLGRTWETFQRTVLGNDTRVHRGPMTPDVLAELTRRMQPQT
jgi:hypothetical protein